MKKLGYWLIVASATVVIAGAWANALKEIPIDRDRRGNMRPMEQLAREERARTLTAFFLTGGILFAGGLVLVVTHRRKP